MNAPRLIRFFIALCAAAPLSAEVKLASPFGDHMVLQQGRAVPVWGTADVGEKVTVEFAGQKKSATAGANGQWRVNLDPLTVSTESRELRVSSGNPQSEIRTLKLSDVLVGEVWIAGGQSNMERQLGLRSPQQPLVNWQAEVAAANHPLIREFYVPHRSAPAPQATVPGTWTVCSPATVAEFSAVGYFFARDLLAARPNVPVGIIHSSWGGTPAEAWTSAEGLAAFPEFGDALVQLKQVAANPAEAQRLYAERLAAWYATNDPGSGAKPFSSPGLNDSTWEIIQLPVPWEEAGHAGYDGVAWFRKSFDLPEGWAGQEVELRLGAVDDIDTTWVNGVQVGATTGWQVPRIYRVPAAVLKPRGNVVAVRVLDPTGNGGLWNPELLPQVVLAKGTDAPIMLAGAWRANFSRPLVGAPRLPAAASPGAGTPTALFNAMIAPLVPYALRGVAFYQGEANAERAKQYRTLLPALIADWRRLWGQGDFPFLFVQIAPFQGQPPEIREAQLLAWQTTKNTAMVVTIDVGDANDIHPTRKAPVGARLALAARALAYGERLEYSGPVYLALSVADGRVTLSFTHLGGGLVAKDGPLTGFTVAGADGIFHPATAVISGDTVIVSAPQVATPVAVRYGWANVAQGNLFNAAGLPASPFRTDVN